MRLGVCYYPEQWDMSLWRDDARRMVDVGIQVVRIGEFAWSRIEPSPENFDWGWYDEAIDILANAGLFLILGTPTATPPKWLIDKYPEVLAWDKEGRPRNFGSRRHYCFSSAVYREQSKRIIKTLATRYGQNDSVIGWQTDNEYGCHDTVRSYSPAARDAFRLWLQKRYEDIECVNNAWGATFWSQTYRNFDEIDLPNLTVTEPNPSHVLDFYRFSSDQVVLFNRLQTDILRKLSPGRDLYHNYMGLFTDFDHFAVSKDIDVAGWDSYPLGFLDVAPYSAGDKRRYMRQGHPDFAGFHHDLYRACGSGRFAVLEQQPGPVNWAHNNPSPLSGMVRLWTHEAAAHGAELVSYFRWRQAPYAQEQLHAGLLRPDNAPAQAYEEVGQCSVEIQQFAEDVDQSGSDGKATIAMVFCYETQWMSEIQPQGSHWNYLNLFCAWYSAVRKFGHNVDIIPPNGDMNGYALVIIPSLFHISDQFIDTAKKSSAQFIFGPRSGSKTDTMHIPDELAPGKLQSLISVRVVRSESFSDFHVEQGVLDGKEVIGQYWLDHVETVLEPLAYTNNGVGLCYHQKNIYLLTTCPDAKFLTTLFGKVLSEAGLDANLLPEGLRIRSNKGLTYAFNYSATKNELPKEIDPGVFLIGESVIPAAGIAVWEK